MIKFTTIKTKKKILDIKDDNIDIKENDKIAIMGKNGSGKTSLINAILGILKSDNDLKIDVDIKDIGYQMQNNSMFQDLFVFEYIELVLLKKFNQEEIEKYKLEKIYNKKIKSLSGGEKQYLVLFLTTFLDKKIYFFDELTTGLDSKNRNYVINNLIKKNIKTFCLVTHYVEEAIQCCEKILIMDEGKIIIFGEIKKILDERNMNYKIEQNNKKIYFKTLDDAKKNCQENEIIQECNLKDLLIEEGIYEY